MKQWKKIQSDIVFDSPYVKVEKKTMQLPNGENNSYNIVHERGDAVIVVAVTEQKEIILIKQYFISVERYAYACVAGLVEAHETMEETAKKELREEAGYTSENFVFLGSVLKGKWTVGQYHFYIALDATYVGEQQLDSSEDIDVMIMSQAEARRMLEEGEIEDSHCALGLYKAFDYIQTHVT